MHLYWAIIGIAQAPLSEVVKLTDTERKSLIEKASGAVAYKSFPDVGDDVVDGDAWCAKWLLTQLEPENQGIE